MCVRFQNKIYNINVDFEPLAKSQTIIYFKT